MVHSKLLKELENGEIAKVRLTDTYSIKPFDCGVADLNDFLFNDAKTHLRYLSAVTYLFENKDKTIAYYMSFLTDNKTGCQFLTVDALNNVETIHFYEKNGFSFVTLLDYNKPSRQMYKNLITLKQLEYL